jgi:hypothetical protein
VKIVRRRVTQIYNEAAVDTLNVHEQRIRGRIADDRQLRSIDWLRRRLSELKAGGCRQEKQCGANHPELHRRNIESILAPVNPLETVAALFGIISVYLSVRQNIWSWPTAIVNVGLYTFVFYQSRLYADMGLQVVYVVISFYGWYQWLYGGQGHTELKVSVTPRKLGIALAGLGIVSRRSFLELCSIARRMPRSPISTRQPPAPALLRSG